MRGEERKRIGLMVVWYDSYEQINRDRGRREKGTFILTH